jgi:hypothetical protein
VVEAARSVGDPCQLIEVVANPAQGSDGRRVDATKQPVAESCLADVSAGWQADLCGEGLDLLALLGSTAGRFHESEASPVRPPYSPSRSLWI